MHLLITGATPAARLAAAKAQLGSAQAVRFDTNAIPFVRPTSGIAPEGSTLLLSDIDRAFPNEQSGGTRLVLTQSTYSIQKWIDHLGDGGRIVATADRGALERTAPEAFRHRGPWNEFEVLELATTEDTEDTEVGSQQRHSKQDSSVASASSVVKLLISAYASTHGEDRVAMCREAAELDPESPIVHLSLASACRETNDMTSARAALDRTIELAPDWEAAHYEDGKFWLSYDDMTRARDAFQRACDLMPTFSAAFSNLGATAGELDEPERALAAFRHAIAHDPHNFQAWNNVGVVSRELGNLVESEAAFHRVIAEAPEFVFGYYNLGHTLFLAARYAEALAAYEEGQRRDPEKNGRQGCRLAMMRLANGDAAGAERDFWHFANQAPPDERQDLLAEAYEIGSAILALHPELAVHRAVVDRIGREIAP